MYQKGLHMQDIQKTHKSMLFTSKIQISLLGLFNFRRNGDLTFVSAKSQWSTSCPDVYALVKPNSPKQILVR